MPEHPQPPRVCSLRQLFSLILAHRDSFHLYLAESGTFHLAEIKTCTRLEKTVSSDRIYSPDGIRMGRLREMEMFVRVVENGSFSAAARDLQVGQPAISKTIAGLEERLGVRLLVRSTRRLSLTEAGTAFYERALRAVKEANEADAAAKGVGASLEGRLRICAPVTFARLHLVPKLGTFLAAHPCPP